MDAVDMLEKTIGFLLPDDYKKFLREHPDGATFYPKVIQKDGGFISFCDPTKDEGDGKRWLWEPAENTVGQVEIKFWKLSEITDEILQNSGSWKMRCICIGSMNDDRIIVLDCLTEDIYCLEHDNLWFTFNSQEEYDQKLPTKAVCFTDFTSLLDWCISGWTYNPNESDMPYVEKWKQRQKNYPKNVIYL